MIQKQKKSYLKCLFHCNFNNDNLEKNHIDKISEDFIMALKNFPKFANYCHW